MKTYNVKVHNVNLTKRGGYSLLVIGHIDENTPASVHP